MWCPDVNTEHHTDGSRMGPNNGYPGVNDTSNNWDIGVVVVSCDQLVDYELVHSLFETFCEPYTEGGKCG